MNAILGFVRATLVGGVLFLVPIMLAAMFLRKVMELAYKIIHPLASRMPGDRVFGIPFPTLLAVTAVVLFCLLAGLFARTALARKVVAWLETALLSKMPGYQFFKDVRESRLGIETSETWPVVLIRFDDTWQIAFRVDEIEGGRITVFVPDAPNGKSGSFHLMTADRVQSTDIRLAAALKCLKRFGAGSDELLRGAIKETGAAG